jgi:hypothetical protein
MKRAIVLLLAGIVLAAPAHARPRHWYTDWKWYAGEAVIVGAVVADGRSTCLGFSRGLVENNPLARGSQSCGASVGALTVGAVAYTGLHAWYHTLPSDSTPKFWKAVNVVAIPIVVCSFHCTAAINNYAQLPPR